MSYDQTHDTRFDRDARVVVTDRDGGARTIMYVVVALVALGLIYLAASAFWGSSTTTVPSTTIDNTTVIPAQPDALAPPPADTLTPAPDAMAPAAPDTTAPSLDAAPPAIEPAPVPAPAPAPAQ